MTLYEIVSEPLKNLKSNGNNLEKTVRETFDRVGISSSDMNRYPNEISMGFQQRVGIARAIVSNPRLIILDEPTSALDPTARAEIIELLIQIQKDLSTSYLFISHDLSAVKHISHKVAILYLGKIIEQGDADRIFASPRHPYSLGLLSSVLLPSTSVKRPTSVSLDGEIPSPINLPTGCSLKSRCPFREEPCEDIPETVHLSDNHVVHACKQCLIKTAKVNINDYFEKFEQENQSIQ
jgi:oligopeptide/dipeptide ABC transporter ATP-binding protein